MRFQQLIDNPDSPVFRVPGFPDALYPSECPNEIANQISNHYYDYDIAIAPPWRWVERWHYVIKRHIYQWQKLIASEQMLRDEDGIYNYDLTETETGTGTNESTSAGTGTSRQIVSDTPDGSISDIDTYMSGAGKNVDENETSISGTSETSRTLRRRGNIGVMTSSRILGGYRDAINYDAYKTIFADLDHMFIGVFDLDSDGDLDGVVIAK